MRILLSDDDPRITGLLQNYVTEFFKSRAIRVPDFLIYTDGDQIIKELPRADLAFLDVEMPGVSGIQAGAKLKEKYPSIKIIIVTSFPDYLDEAMRFHVFRYLSKPIDKDRLFRNLSDALFEYNMESKLYPIVTADGVFTRKAEEIICVQSQLRKNIIHTTDGVFINTDPFAHWIHTLDLPCFYLVHRSFIVNMRFIYNIEKDEVTLRHGAEDIKAYLSRRKYTLFKAAYLQFLGGGK